MSTTSDKSKTNVEPDASPLLYYRSREQIEAYRHLTVEDKLRRLEMMAEFFHYAMPEKSKRLRERFKERQIRQY